MTAQFKPNTIRSLKRVLKIVSLSKIFRPNYFLETFVSTKTVQKQILRI